MKNYSRVEKGLEIAKRGDVELIGHVYGVKGDRSIVYRVDHNIVDDIWSCTCPDFKYRDGGHCKHINAVKIEEEMAWVKKLEKK